jgi:hypothetical protein
VPPGGPFAPRPACCWKGSVHLARQNRAHRAAELPARSHYMPQPPPPPPHTHTHTHTHSPVPPDAARQVIAAHLFHEGLFEVGQAFVEEAGVAEGEALRRPYASMHAVLREVRPWVVCGDLWVGGWVGRF